MSAARRQVAVVVGATSKWQADGRNTRLAHGKALDDSDIPVGIRWGIGGAVAQKFSMEGFFVVLTTRHAANASALEKAIDAGDPDVLVYNAGYLEGRDLPPEKELLEHIPLASVAPAPSSSPTTRRHCVAANG